MKIKFAIVAFLITAVSVCGADNRQNRNRPSGGRSSHHNDYNRNYHRNDAWGYALGGLVIGTIIGSAIAEPQYVGPQYAYPYPTYDLIEVRVYRNGYWRTEYQRVYRRY